MATYTTSAPGATVDKKYKGSYGPLTGAKFASADPTRTRRAVVCLLTAVGTYTAGGDAITMADLPLSQVLAAYLVADNATGHTQSATTANLAEFDLSTPTAPKIKWYSAAATELANATSIANRTLLVRLEGI